MSYEPTERDVEAVAEAVRARLGSTETARLILTSAWYAERIAQARREGAAEALRSAAAEASWMEYPASQDPIHWATWLRDRAATLRGET